MADGFGVRPVRSVERLEMTEARPSDCRALGVRRAAPLLLVERIRYAADGTPVEFARDRFRADRTGLGSCSNRPRSGGVRSSARAVVIGGGVGGCSILYWLTRLGWDDVVLVERADLTSGSTFHSAGLVGQLRSSLALTRMMMNSVELYRTLEEEVGLETGWREVGSLRLASLAGAAGGDHAAGRLGEDVRAAARADLRRRGAGSCSRRCRRTASSAPRILPSDGYIDPSQLTFALAEGARRRGAEVNTTTRVTGITVERGEVRGVETDKGEIETEIVSTPAACMRARSARSPASTSRSSRWRTSTSSSSRPACRPDMPTMRDPSLLVYFRPESGGLIMGGYERHCAPWSLDGIPPDFNGKLLEEDWPRFEELMQNAIVRVPSLEEMEVVKLINGPEAFTPDGEFILGPSDVRGFWVAAGFCAHGLAGAGGMGQLVAEWIVEGTPSLDVWHMDSRRFGAAYRSREYTLARTTEIYETYYDVKYPGHERSAGRPLRVSPAYARLVELGAVVRREVGLGAGELVRAERRRAATSRCGRAAGRASCGRPRSVPSIAPAARRSRSSTSRRSRRSTSRGAGRGRVPRVAVRQPGRPRRRRRHVHADAERARRHRVRLHRDAARRGPLPDRHRDGVRPARPRVDPPARAATTARCTSPT